MNPLDRAQFNPVPYGQVQPQQNFNDILQRARQNPKEFEEYVRRTNPQAFDRAMQIRNGANPQAVVRQLAQARGLDPNILRMFGL